MAGNSATAIACPRCGSTLDFQEGVRNVVCISCKTPHAVSGESGIARFYLPAKFDLPAARSAARKFLATAGIDEALASRLKFGAGELCFLPFWRLRGTVAGWQWLERETVVKEDYVDENGQKRERERRGPLEQTSELVVSRLDYSSPACDLTPFGLQGIATVSSVLTLKGVRYDHLAGLGAVFDPVKEPAQVRREAIASARNRAQPRGLVRNESHLNLCGEQLSLISYPVWKLTFSLGERLYPLVVDGINGRILKGRFPGKMEIRLLAPMATITGLVFAFTLHVGVGFAALAGFSGWFAASQGVSLEALCRYFFQLVVRGEEIEHG